MSEKLEAAGIIRHVGQHVVEYYNWLYREQLIAWYQREYSK